MPEGVALGRRVVWAVPFAAVGVAAVLIASRGGVPSPGLALGVPAGIGLLTWTFFSERIEGPLVGFLLYLGLLDGFLKLRTDSSVITLGRDGLLYAILLGFLARSALRRRSLRLPALSGWVLAFTVSVLVQVANPANAGLLHTLGALRPHLEFVPLFFVGYAVLQTSARLQTFVLIMLVVAMANGIVGGIQLNLSPRQLASWGPGYANRVNGLGVSARTFDTSAGQDRTRPFGLGDDTGVGAAWGMLALGGALALLSFGVQRRIGRVSLLLCAGPPLAIITGETRSLLVCSVVALIAYVAFATTVRRLIPTLTAVVIGLAVVVGVVAYISSVSGAGVFDRYASISPGKLVSTTSQSRSESFAAIPELALHHPLGDGLGSAGPASAFAGGSNGGGNGETEPGFLLSELGLPGLLVVFGFNMHLLFLGAARIRYLEPETRSLIAALLAGIVGLLVLGVSSSTTATSPFSPYFWFASGALSYWLTVGVSTTRFGARRSAPELAVPQG